MLKETVVSIFRGAYASLLLGAVSAVHPAGSIADEQRAIPEDNLAYPVLIMWENGSTGSGFYVNTGTGVYLVTAKHVLFDERTHNLPECGFDPITQKALVCWIRLLSYSKDPEDQTRDLLRLDLSVLQKNGDVKAHPSRDVAAVRLFSVTKPADSPPAPGSAQGPAPPRRILSLPGVTVESMAKDGILGVDIGSIKPFNRVLVGNDVVLFGYPTSLGLKQTPQLDPRRPLLRKGIVAGTDPSNESIVLDCPVYFGNSGGPVLELDRVGFMTHLVIIGVVSQYVPFVEVGGSNTVAMQVMANSGYSIATPMDFVLELIK